MNILRADLGFTRFKPRRRVDTMVILVGRQSEQTHYAGATRRCAAARSGAPGDAFNGASAVAPSPD